MCKADNDVWYRPAIKPDGTKYYEHILVYTDDILCLSMNPSQSWITWTSASYSNLSQEDNQRPTWEQTLPDLPVTVSQMSSTTGAWDHTHM